MGATGRTGTSGSVVRYRGFPPPPKPRMPICLNRRNSPTPEPVQAAAPIDDGLESALLAGLADEPAAALEGSDEPLEARPASHADVETPEADPIPEFDFERTLLEGLPDGSTASFDDADPSDLPESAAPMPEASPAATGPGPAALPDADDFASELLDGLSDGLEVSSGEPDPPDLPAAPGTRRRFVRIFPRRTSPVPGTNCRTRNPTPSPRTGSTRMRTTGPSPRLPSRRTPTPERVLREGLLRYESPSSGLDEPQAWPGGIRAAISALADGHSSSLVIVDLDGISFPVGAIHELAEVCEAGTAVIALGSEDTARVSREVLLAGVSDYLVKPVTAEAIRQAALRGDRGRECLAGAGMRGRVRGHRRKRRDDARRRDRAPRGGGGPLRLRAGYQPEGAGDGSVARHRAGAGPRSAVRGRRRIGLRIPSCWTGYAPSARSGSRSTTTAWRLPFPRFRRCRRWTGCWASCAAAPSSCWSTGSTIRRPGSTCWTSWTCACWRSSPPRPDAPARRAWPDCRGGGPRCSSCRTIRASSDSTRGAKLLTEAGVGAPPDAAIPFDASLPGLAIRGWPGERLPRARCASRWRRSAGRMFERGPRRVAGRGRRGEHDDARESLRTPFPSRSPPLPRSPTATGPPHRRRRRCGPSPVPAPRLSADGFVSEIVARVSPGRRQVARHVEDRRR